MAKPCLPQVARKQLADSPAVLALPAQRLQQARQALRATQYGAALAGVLVATATTQRSMGALAVLVDKVVAGVAVAG